jgi:hypothetical protein
MLAVHRDFDGIRANVQSDTCGLYRFATEEIIRIQLDIGERQAPGNYLDFVRA